MVAVENEQQKQINKQYTKQYQKMLLIAMNTWVQQSPKLELRL
jgi:hypothetical protein